jgi:hypothetical protein
MKTYRGVDVYIHVFLTLTLVGGKWSASRSGPPPPGKEFPVTTGLEARWAGEPVWPTWRKVLPLLGFALQPYRGGNKK